MLERVPELVIGITFVSLGVVKLVGLAVGVEGGRDKPLPRRLCGT